MFDCVMARSSVGHKQSKKRSLQEERRKWEEEGKEKEKREEEEKKKVDKNLDDHTAWFVLPDQRRDGVVQVVAHVQVVFLH